MHLEIWNVQRLKSTCEIIIKDLEQLKLDIITLLETRKCNGLEMIDGFLPFYGVSKEKRTKRGVSIILKRKLKLK
jgi:hypothetical protein